MAYKYNIRPLFQNDLTLVLFAQHGKAGLHRITRNLGFHSRGAPVGRLLSCEGNSLTVISSTKNTAVTTSKCPCITVSGNTRVMPVFHPGWCAGSSFPSPVFGEDAVAVGIVPEVRLADALLAVPAML